MARVTTVPKGSEPRREHSDHQSDNGEQQVDHGNAALDDGMQEDEKNFISRTRPLVGGKEFLIQQQQYSSDDQDESMDENDEKNTRDVDEEDEKDSTEAEALHFRPMGKQFRGKQLRYEDDSDDDDDSDMDIDKEDDKDDNEDDDNESKDEERLVKSPIDQHLDENQPVHTPDNAQKLLNEKSILHSSNFPAATSLLVCCFGSETEDCELRVSSAAFNLRHVDVNRLTCKEKENNLAIAMLDPKKNIRLLINDGFDFTVSGLVKLNENEDNSFALFSIIGNDLPVFAACPLELSIVLTALNRLELKGISDPRCETNLNDAVRSLLNVLNDRLPSKDNLFEMQQFIRDTLNQNNDDNPLWEKSWRSHVWEEESDDAKSLQNNPVFCSRYIQVNLPLSFQIAFNIGGGAHRCVAFLILKHHTLQTDASLSTFAESSDYEKFDRFEFAKYDINLKLRVLTPDLYALGPSPFKDLSAQTQSHHEHSEPLGPRDSLVNNFQIILDDESSASSGLYLDQLVLTSEEPHLTNQILISWFETKFLRVAHRLAHDIFRDPPIVAFAIEADITLESFTKEMKKTVWKEKSEWPFFGGNNSQFLGKMSLNKRKKGTPHNTQEITNSPLKKIHFEVSFLLFLAVESEETFRKTIESLRFTKFDMKQRRVPETWETVEFFSAIISSVYQSIYFCTRHGLKQNATSKLNFDSCRRLYRVGQLLLTDSFKTGKIYGELPEQNDVQGKHDLSWSLEIEKQINKFDPDALRDLRGTSPLPGHTTELFVQQNYELSLFNQGETVFMALITAIKHDITKNAIDHSTKLKLNAPDEICRLMSSSEPFPTELPHELTFGCCITQLKQASKSGDYACIKSFREHCSRGMSSKLLQKLETLSKSKTQKEDHRKGLQTELPSIIKSAEKISGMLENLLSLLSAPQNPLPPDFDELDQKQQQRAREKQKKITELFNSFKEEHFPNDTIEILKDLEENARKVVSQPKPIAESVKNSSPADLSSSALFADIVEDLNEEDLNEGNSLACQYCAELKDESRKLLVAAGILKTCACKKVFHDICFQSEAEKIIPMFSDSTLSTQPVCYDCYQSSIILQFCCCANKDAGSALCHLPYIPWEDVEDDSALCRTKCTKCQKFAHKRCTIEDICNVCRANQEN